MLVRLDGSIAGTIGGGKLEGNAIQMALDVLREKKSRLAAFEFSGEDAASMDMICGGSVRVMLEYVPAGDANFKDLLSQIDLARDQSGTLWLGTQWNPKLEITHVLHTEAEPVIAEWIDRSQGTALQSVQGGEVFFERLAFPPRAILFGAGHVSRALAEAVQLAGFAVMVVDERAEFANLERFPRSDVRVVEPIEAFFDQVAVRPSDYVIVVTRGHLLDGKVVEHALRTPATYIGMIGSRRKKALIYQSLMEKGFAEADLARIYAPIGLPIGAETPEEIAISITAEMIQHRNLGGKRT